MQGTHAGDGAAAMEDVAQAEDAGRGEGHDAEGQAAEAGQDQETRQSGNRHDVSLVAWSPASCDMVARLLCSVLLTG